MKTEKINEEDFSQNLELDLIAFFNIVFEDIMNRIDEDKNVEEIINDIESIFK